VDARFRYATFATTGRVSVQDIGGGGMIGPGWRP
jgi:hypothetical protein